MEIDNEKEVIALGREIFTDLWRLFGFKIIVCDDPNDVHKHWKEINSQDVAVIITEENWFFKMPLRLRLLAERSISPAWVKFPTLLYEGEDTLV